MDTAKKAQKDDIGLTMWDAMILQVKAPAATTFEEPPTLDEFARDYVMRGEKIVAAQTLSRNNNKFYGQWLMLHVPFDRATDFLRDEIDELVPQSLRYLAMALQCEHPAARVWKLHDAIEDEMRLEGCAPKFREHFHKQFAVQKKMVVPDVASWKLFNKSTERWFQILCFQFASPSSL